MQKIAIALLFSLSNFAVSAQNLSEQDLNLMAASLKAVEIYNAGGMSGLFNGIGQCYSQLKQKNPAPRKDIEFCVAMDMSGVFLDYWMSQAAGFPRDKRFTDAVAANRMHGVLERFGISNSGNDSGKYFGDRDERVEKYTNRAISITANGAAKSDTPEKCITREMLKWEKKRERDISKWCADLAKKGQECRTSAGQDELVRQEALEGITSKCQ